MNVEEIVGEYNGENEELFLSDSMIYILDKTTLKTKRIYISGDNVDWEKKDLDQMLTDIINGLKGKFDVEVYLKEFLITRTAPALLLDLHERVMNKAKVTSKPRRCYSMDVGGKRGHPLELAFVQNLGEGG